MLNNSQYAKLKTDEASTTVTYVGYAQTNFVTDGQELWSILKIESENATSPYGVTTYKWSGTPGDFRYKWTDRASLTYNS